MGGLGRAEPGREVVDGQCHNPRELKEKGRRPREKRRRERQRRGRRKKEKRKLQTRYTHLAIYSLR